MKPVTPKIICIYTSQNSIKGQIKTAFLAFLRGKLPQ